LEPVYLPDGRIMEKQYTTLSAATVGTVTFNYISEVEDVIGLYTVATGTVAVTGVSYSDNKVTVNYAAAVTGTVHVTAIGWQG